MLAKKVSTFYKTLARLVQKLVHRDILSLVRAVQSRDLAVDLLSDVASPADFREVCEDECALARERTQEWNASRAAATNHNDMNDMIPRI